MRILIISQYFDPEPFFKGLPFAKELVRRGHDVEILTGFPNYPGGKLYPGYRLKLVMRESMDGVSVIRVALYPAHGRSVIKRISNYLSFAVSAGVLGPFLVRKADVAYVYHPPPTVGFAALTILLTRRIPYVYDIQDLWPESLAATGMVNNRFILSTVTKWCALVYRFASSIVVLSPGFKEILTTRGVPYEKVNVIYNWAPESGSASPSELNRETLLGNDEFKIVFAGNMGPAQALESILVAAKLMREKLPKVKLIFLGDGISLPALKEFAISNELTNVMFLPRVSQREAAEVCKQADALLVHLKHDPLFTITIPSKTQAYLESGKPILIGVDGDAKNLVEQAGAGFSFQPEDPFSFLGAVQKLLELSRAEREQLGRNGHDFYRQNLSRQIAVEKFDKLFRFVKDALDRSKKT